VVGGDGGGGTTWRVISHLALGVLNDSVDLARQGRPPPRPGTGEERA
jgi:hypothetical protein